MNTCSSPPHHRNDQMQHRGLQPSLSSPLWYPTHNIYCPTRRTNFATPWSSSRHAYVLPPVLTYLVCLGMNAGCKFDGDFAHPYVPLTASHATGTASNSTATPLHSIGAALHSTVTASHNRAASFSTLLRRYCKEHQNVAGFFQEEDEVCVCVLCVCMCNAITFSRRRFTRWNTFSRNRKCLAS
jgi:hypothetical protein